MNITCGSGSYTGPGSGTVWLAEANWTRYRLWRGASYETTQTIRIEDSYVRDGAALAIGSRRMTCL